MKAEMDESGWRLDGNNSAVETNNLKEVRERIDRLDEGIAILLTERFKLCRSLTSIKEGLGLPVRNRERENQVLSQVAQCAPDDELQTALVSVYESIFESSRAMQSQPSAEANTGRSAASNYFPTVTIIGMGLIGGAMAALIRKQIPSTEIIGVDTEAIVAKALAEKLISKGETDALKALDSSALIVLAATPKVNVQLLKQIAPLLKDRQLVIDVTSTKKEICDIAEDIDLKGADFIGGHPLFGSEKSGLEASGDISPEGSTFCLVPTAKSSEISIRRLMRWLSALNLKTELIQPDTHDSSLALTSHLVQVLAVVIGGQLAEGKTDHQLERALTLTGPSFQQLSRLMQSSPKLWSEILQQNTQNVAVAAKQVSERLNKIVAMLEANEEESLSKEFDLAARIPKTLKRMKDKEAQ